MSNKFEEAIQACPDLKDALRQGLQALKANSTYVKAKDTNSLEGSVDMDDCLKKTYPDDARWDYVIGYDRKIYFVEIHPASTSGVDDVIKKAKWLNIWLKGNGQSLMKGAKGLPFYWVPTGKVKIRDPKSERKLAQVGVHRTNSPFWLSA